MKNIKDITISIFAIIGFMAIISSFTNQSQREKPYTLATVDANNDPHMYVLNQITGEVRYFKYSQEYELPEIDPPQEVR
tara:strand:+ start:56 stop:292 length:237 start_codon:yes stop_codon:yes gene_type:complete